MSWDAFAESVTEAQKLAQPRTSISCTASARATPRCAATRRNFSTRPQAAAAPAAKNVLDAIELLRDMNTDNARKVPCADAPTAFIKPRWQAGDE